MKYFKMIFTVIIFISIAIFQTSYVYAAYSPYMFTSSCVTDGNGDKITDFEGAQTAVFTGIVKKNTVSAQDASVIGVLYRNGVVFETQILKIKNAELTEEIPIYFEIKLPVYRKNLTYKVFIWDTKNAKPLAPVFEFSKKDEQVQLEQGAIVTETADELVSAIGEKNNAGGGTIYIKADKIYFDSQIKLSESPKNTVKILAYPGYTPVLDFSALKAENSYNYVGILITGSNYYVNGLIIEKAGDNGILILGRAASNNIVEDCIFRYNKDTGCQISQSAANNTIKNCYSYRNFDIHTARMGGNADGFAIKLSYVNNPASADNTGYGNKLIHCYAWENSDDGYDSYDWYEDVSYENFLVWNNGYIGIFTGEYDFKNKKQLDENSPLISLFMKDEVFRANIEKGIFEIPGKVEIPFRNNQTVAEAIPTWGGNPNGFKFGSGNVIEGTVRTGKNMIALDHNEKGFDQNGSRRAEIRLSNALAFNNGINYSLSDMIITKFEKIFGFKGKSVDNMPNEFKVITPSQTDCQAYEEEVRSMINYIENSARANIIPKDIAFSFWD